jgi:aconitase B
MSAVRADDVRVGDCVKIDGHWRRVSTVLKQDGLRTMGILWKTGPGKTDQDGESFGLDELVTVAR